MDTLKNDIQKTAAKYGLDLITESMTVESMGLDFQVVFADDSKRQEWVCRIPRRKEVYEKAIKEKEILDFIISHQSTFQIPVWEIATEEIIVYKKLTGIPAVTTDSETQEPVWVFDSQAVPDAYLDSLAQVLAVLHALPLNQARESGLTVQTAEEVRQSMKDRMQKVNDRFEVDSSLWDRWQKWVDSKEMWPEKTCIIHGDLFPGHTLIDDEYRVNGVIDWTEAEGSDSSVDFTAFYLLFGEEALNKLLNAYQKAGGYVWPEMKDHIIERLSTQAITIAEFALSSGLEEYHEMAQNMLLNKA